LARCVATRTSVHAPATRVSPGVGGEGRGAGRLESSPVGARLLPHVP